MKKESKNIFKNMTTAIDKLSKTTLILIAVAYIVIAGLIVSTVGKGDNNLFISPYTHEDYSKDVNVRISVVGLRTYTDGKEHLNYSIGARITTRPGAKVSEKKKIYYKMSASIVDGVKNTRPNDVYFFTEHDSFSPPITHNYNLNSGSTEKHPYKIYTLIEYEKEGKKKVLKTEEKVMLTPTSEDSRAMNEYKNINKEPHFATSITNKKGEEAGKVQFVSNKVSTGYSAGLRISMENKATTRYHIDMQSWVLTETGRYLPFIGVYSYSSKTENYTQSSRKIPNEVKPAYLCAKLIYMEDGFTNIVYFKQDIKELGTSFQSQPKKGKQPEIEKMKNSPILYIGVTLGAIGVVAVAIYIASKSKKKIEE